MVRVVVEYNGKRFPCEVSASDGVLVLRSVIFSVTDLLPEEQQITGIGPGILTNQSNLETIGLYDGQRIFVKRVPSSAPDALPASSAAVPSSAAPATATATATATGSPFTPQQAMQLAAQLQQLMMGGAGTRSPGSVVPLTSTSTSTSTAVPLSLPLHVDVQSTCSRVYLGDEPISQPNFLAHGQPVCYACAQTCHLPQDIQPRPRTDAVICQCSHITGRECLFGVRVASGMDLLHGDVRFRTISVLSAAAEANASQILAQSTQQMKSRLHSYQRAALEYENKEWQAQARTIIPIETLQQRADKARSDSLSSSSTDPSIRVLSARDELCRQLLLWFKHEFFKWVNAPECERCQAQTNNVGGTAPNATEQQYRAGVVELYRCSSCGHVTRFPRYNHALKLLETRRGRCGEWAQAFTLCCRAMGFEARAANDWTDHVWTEVYSDEEQRWIHYDACEAARDAPMLYESGWGKKLNYVIAFSHEECVDVTRRYTQKWNEVLSRRTLCTEAWLSREVSSLNTARISLLSSDRRSIIERRALVEQQQLAQHVCSKDETIREEEKHGRITGSVEWRAARGELGTNTQISIDTKTNTSTPITKAIDSTITCTVPPATTSSGSSPNTSTSTSTSTSTAPVDKAAAARELAKQWFTAYHHQLTVGCGRSTCDNVYCKSSPGCVVLNKDAASITKICVALVSKYQNKHLCNAAPNTNSNTNIATATAVTENQPTATTTNTTTTT